MLDLVRCGDMEAVPPGSDLESFDNPIQFPRSWTGWWWGTCVIGTETNESTMTTAGDGRLDQGAHILLFGPPGGGKSHLAAALGLALVQNGRRVLFMRTTDLVQRLQVARRELGSKPPSPSSTSTSC